MLGLNKPLDRFGSTIRNSKDSHRNQDEFYLIKGGGGGMRPPPPPLNTLINYTI